LILHHVFGILLRRFRSFSRFGQDTELLNNSIHANYLNLDNLFRSWIMAYFMQFRDYSEILMAKIFHCNIKLKKQGGSICPGYQR